MPEFRAAAEPLPPSPTRPTRSAGRGTVALALVCALAAAATVVGSSKVAHELMTPPPRLPPPSDLPLLELTQRGRHALDRGDPARAAAWLAAAYLAPGGEHDITVRYLLARATAALAGTAPAQSRELGRSAFAVGLGPGGELMISGPEGSEVLTTPPTLLSCAGAMSSGLVASPDGHLLAHACWNGTARLVRRADGAVMAELAHFAAGGQQALGVAFSPDSRDVVTWAGSLVLWSAESGTRLGEVTPAAAVHTAAFSPDGAVLALGLMDGSVELRDRDGGAPRQLGRLDAAVYALAFSPDGDQLVAGGLDGIVRVFDLGGRELSRLSRPGGPVYAVAFSPDGTRIATASYGGLVHLWNAASYQHLGSLQVGAHPLALAFDAGGQHLHVANETRTLSRWDVGLDPRSQAEVARWAVTLPWQLDGDALVSPGRGRP
ncbi:MAG: PD40 domain-containing protein [Deltaproteobacteria bacterium]|nr:PD40 domain-containing protein [Deltaproteobacteria bacterium]